MTTRSGCNTFAAHAPPPHSCLYEVSSCLHAAAVQLTSTIGSVLPCFWQSLQGIVLKFVCCENGVSDIKSMAGDPMSSWFGSPLSCQAAACLVVRHLPKHRMHPQMVVRVPPALPPKQAEPAGADPKNKQAPRGPSAWGFECFLQVRPFTLRRCPQPACAELCMRFAARALTNESDVLADLPAPSPRSIALWCSMVITALSRSCAGRRLPLEHGAPRPHVLA